MVVTGPVEVASDDDNPGLEATIAAWTEGDDGVDDDIAWVVAEPVEVACEEDDPALEAAAAAWTAGDGVDVDVELYAAGVDKHDEDAVVSAAIAATGLPAADDEDEDGVAVAL